MTVTDLTIGGVKMPTPAVEGLSISREKIWSANTGRTGSGRMVGSIVAIKTKVSIRWPVLTMAQVRTIENAVSSGAEFLTLSYTDMTGTTKSLSGYFGAPSYTIYSYAQGVQWVKDVSVDFIER